MRSSSSATGSIYDLGYRPYEGKRLGRVYAIQSLYWYSLRSVFGIGRSIGAKVFPWGLLAVALLPAITQIGFAALVPLDDFEFVSHEGHFRFIRPIVALFCAVAAPDLTGRDQRARTLTLYFSRAVSRGDYVTAKLAALTTALFLLTFVPQILLLIGNAVATNDVAGYVSDNLGEIPPILGSSLAIAMVMGSISLAISAQSSRRAISTISVLGFFSISLALSDILINIITGDARGLSLLSAPMNTLDGLTYWFFNASPGIDSALAKADLEGYVYLLVATAYSAISMGLLYRRYQRMSV